MDDSDNMGAEAAGPSRRWGHRRWLFLVVPVLAVAVVVSLVLQSGGGGANPLNAIAKAAEVTRREPGGRARFNVTIDSATTAEGLTEDGSMIFDDNGRARGTFRVKGHSTGREEKLLIISDGAKSYTRSDELKSLPDGKKWVGIDLSGAVKGPPGSTASQAGPEEGLKFLEKVIGAKQIGKEEIDGVPTTRYSGTMPTAEEVFGVKPDYSNSSVEAWIDAQGRVRRIQLELTGGLSGKPDTVATTSMRIDYVEFVRVPKIDLPPPDEVDDITAEVEKNIQAAATGG